MLRGLFWFIVAFVVLILLTSALGLIGPLEFAVVVVVSALFGALMSRTSKATKSVS